jgi:hypothetical protein
VYKKFFSLLVIISSAGRFARLHEISVAFHEKHLIFKGKIDFRLQKKRLFSRILALISARKNKMHSYIFYFLTCKRKLQYLRASSRIVIRMFAQLCFGCAACFRTGGNFMDKKRYRRPLRCIACAVLCAFLLAGCSVPSGKTASSAQPGGAAEPEMGVGTALDDGALRVLAGGGNSMATVFCGAHVLYTAPIHGTAYVLTDGNAQDASYYVASAPEGSDQYIRRICDKTGKELYACGTDEYPLGLCNGWVLTGISRQTEMAGFSSCRLVELATGKTQDIPDGAYQFFEVTPDLFCVSGSTWTDDGTQSTAFAYLYNANMEQVETISDASACIPYWTDGTFAPGWLELSPCSQDGSAACRYYNPATQQTIENVAGTCGRNFVCLRTDDGCPVMNIDTGETLATCPYPCELYLAASGNAIYYNQADDSYRDYMIHSDGTEEALVNYGVQESDGTVAVLFEDRLEIYDASGALLWTKPVDALPENQSRFVSAVSGGRCMITISESDTGNFLPVVLYGADGSILESASYSNVYQAYEQDYLIAQRDSAPGATLIDILDLDGKPLITGLKDICGTQVNHVLPASKGFEEGWMDFSGNWLWKRSIWQTASDDAVNQTAWD